MKQGFFRWLSLGASDTASYFGSPPVLDAGEVFLRPLMRTDADDLYAWCSDPEVARYVLWSPHRSLSDTRRYLRYIRALYREGLPASWGIVLRQTGRVVGTIGWMAWSPENRAAEVGYSLARFCWNRGYMTAALSAVLRSGFESLPVDRIEGRFDLRNPASGRVMEKCGMRREGVLRSAMVNKGEQIDMGVCAILRSDWESVQSPE